jgi:hypothetical protein
MKLLGRDLRNVAVLNQWLEQKLKKGIQRNKREGILIRYKQLARAWAANWKFREQDAVDNSYEDVRQSALFWINKIEHDFSSVSIVRGLDSDSLDFDLILIDNKVKGGFMDTIPFMAHELLDRPYLESYIREGMMNRDCYAHHVRRRDNTDASDPIPASEIESVC